MCLQCPAEYHHHQHDAGRTPVAPALELAAPVVELAPASEAAPATPAELTPAMEAQAYVESLGFAPAAAANIVFAQGAPAILAHKADALKAAAATAEEATV